MNKFLKYLKTKGYVINGNEAVLLGVEFKIRSGIIETAMGIRKSYWLELV